MTANYNASTSPRRPTKVKHVDLVRGVANVLGLFGVLFTLLTAGSSDAGLLSVSELILRAAFGLSLIVLWRVLHLVANELSLRGRTAPRRASALHRR